SRSLGPPQGERQGQACIPRTLPAPLFEPWRTLRRPGRGGLYTFLRNEPTDFRSKNMAYLSGQQCVTQEKFRQKRWVRFGKRTHRRGVSCGLWNDSYGLVILRRTR